MKKTKIKKAQPKKRDRIDYSIDYKTRQKMTKEQTKSLLKRYNAIANARIRYWKKIGIKSIQVERLQSFKLGRVDSKESYSSRLSAVIKFLNSPGYSTEFGRQQDEYIYKNIEFEDDEQKRNFWRAYDHFMKQDGMREIYQSYSGTNQVLSWLIGRMSTGKYSFRESAIYNALKRENKLTNIPPQNKFGKFEVRKKS